MKTRIYIDTSVIGGCEDVEFKEFSQRLIDSFSRGDFIMVLSDLTIKELEKSPPGIRSIIRKIPEVFIEIVTLSDDAVELAKSYIQYGVIGKRYIVDSQHIAIATVERVDVLVSWNFKHIVNLFKIRGYNAVNLRSGYPVIEIRTPREVLENE
ncbi:MAG: PIN domain protein [Candidatus Schekmanbacteria bacterium RBG_13_48_7]|uniref:PIN domain protein n=1 Tax=Candidatus Schekmanbacteria bacterium RBG_13_48_7 TaxID=1817878 RepID=A0A1F7RT40_9BACT|nr:MAG: PIN domain protein [Candidatus Schekmanbacteria bacterium RBG_13_48_7]